MIMKLAGIISFVLSILLILSSAAIMFFGMQHEINKIPPEVRARMTDTDWIGVEWIMRGFVVFFIAISMQFVGAIFFIISAKYKQRKIARETQSRAILV